MSNQKNNSNKLQILNNFIEIYNTTDNKLLVSDHMYFRYMCFKYIELINIVDIPDFEENSKYETVLIEYRCFPHLEFIIRNTILKLNNSWSHTVICGNLNYEYMTNMCNSISTKIKVIKTDYDNLIPSEYSRFLTTMDFWNLLSGEKILIYQEDSIIFHNNIDEFLKYDFIGAPFPKKDNDTPNSVGNGGFSLRTKSIMELIIQTNSVENTMFEESTIQYMNDTGSYFPPEDIYFSKNMQDLKIGKVASWKDAYDFSSERIYNPNSFGGHKFWISNPKWKKKMKNLFKYSDYKPNSDLLKYLKYNKIPSSFDKTKEIANAFDIDIPFCININNLQYTNLEDILKYIKQVGIKGYIYHPKQVFNLYPSISIHNYMNDIYIKYDNVMYKGSNFVNTFIYNKSYEELRNILITKVFDNLNEKIPLLLLVFIGNEEIGIDLIKKILEYKKIQKFNISFCFISQNILNKFKFVIKKNFSYYSVYLSNNLGTDITPTILMYDDIIQNYSFQHIIKLHTKSILNQYNDLTSYLLNKPLNKLLSKKHYYSNCIGHSNYYLFLKDDIFNKILLFNHHNHIDIKKAFVGGTIFYCEKKVFDTVVNFIKKYNFKSYLLNNLYENNSINKNYSPIHFIERLFGIIQMDTNIYTQNPL